MLITGYSKEIDKKYDSGVPALSEVFDEAGSDKIKLKKK